MLRILAVLSVLVAAGTIALAAWQTVELRRTESLVASAQQDAAALNAQVEPLRRELRPAAPRATAAPTPPALSGKAAQRARIREAVNSDPRVREAVGKMVEYQAGRYFEPWLRSMGLSGEQLDRAKYLYGQLASFEGVGAVALSAKTDPRPEEEIQAELAQVLGADATAALAGYQINRSVTDGLAGTLNAAGTPLTAEQLGQLTQILVDANRQPPAAGGWCDPAATDWKAALAHAQDVLSPAQLQMLRNFAVGRFGASLP